MPIFSATWYCIETGLEWQQRNKGKKRNRQMLSKNNALHETALSSTFWVLHSSGFFFRIYLSFMRLLAARIKWKAVTKGCFFFLFGGANFELHSLCARQGGQNPFFGLDKLHPRSPADSSVRVEKQCKSLWVPGTHGSLGASGAWSSGRRQKMDSIMYMNAHAN